MKIAVMQPYWVPYIGYFQLMNAVDEFIIYDNIKYTKKGWINRNRILFNDKEVYITLPLKKASDFLDIEKRFLAESWIEDRNKIIGRITQAYRRAPFFETVFPIIEESILFDQHNLFHFIFNSITVIKEYLGIKTRLIVSSSIPVASTLKSQEKVLEICNARHANVYINPIGGQSLYDSDTFKKQHINLHFLKTDDITYSQSQKRFIPSLSIVDVMMYNSKEQICEYLNHSYTLL